MIPPQFVCVIRIYAVNDLGGSSDGMGRGHKLADDVVDIIRSRGGVAVANYGESIFFLVLITLRLSLVLNRFCRGGR